YESSNIVAVASFIAGLDPRAVSSWHGTGIAGESPDSSGRTVTRHVNRKEDPMTAVYGEASWFCCGAAWGPCGSAGGGACGTCASSKHQHAWPTVSSACTGITDPGACGVS